MTTGGIALLVFLVVWIATRIQAEWQRGKLLARLRAAWGKVGSTTSSLDDRVPEAWKELSDASGADLAIDERTWLDLDLDRVVAAINRTQTGLGQQVLYWRLRSGTSWTDSPELERLAAQLGREPALREQVAMRLAGGGRSLGYGLWVITRPELIITRWWYWFFPVLAIMMFAALATIPFEPRAFIAVLALVVVNLAVRMATAWQIPGLLGPMRQIGPLIRTAEQLSGIEGIGATEIAADLNHVKVLKRIARWVSRDPLTAGEAAAAMWEYLNNMFILDANALLLSAHHLRRLGPALGRVARWVGDADVALSVAALRAEPRGWCIPVWAHSEETRVAGVWHPLVDAPVANDAELLAGRGMVITGANMSGKSTYLRTIGIAAVLSRAINTCPAASWQGRAFRVRSLIGRNDDLSAGKSYYQVEADGVVALLNDAQQERPTLFLLDELLRGTNTVERLAAGEAVLRALLSHTDRSPHVVIVATHDGELVSMLADLYAPFHFRETIGPDGLTFDYCRRSGPASTRTAIALLESTGAPATVVAAARARAEALDMAARDRPH